MSSRESRTPAFSYTVPPNDLLSPIWILRLFPPAILLAIILAETIFKSSIVHSMLIGLSCGLLISFIVVWFQITGVTMRKDQTRSDVDNLNITR